VQSIPVRQANESHPHTTSAMLYPSHSADANIRIDTHEVDGKGRALVVVTYRFASSIATCTRTRGDINCYLKHEARVPKKVPLVSSGVHSQRVYVLKQSCNELFILE